MKLILTFNIKYFFQNTIVDDPFDDYPDYVELE